MQNYKWYVITQITLMFHSPRAAFTFIQRGSVEIPEGCYHWQFKEDPLRFVRREPEEGLCCYHYSRALEDPLRTRRALSLFKEDPLRTRRALSLFKEDPLRTRRGALSLFKEDPLRTRRALSLFKEDPLRSRRALSLFKEDPLRTRGALSLFKEDPLRTRRALWLYIGIVPQ